MASPFRSNTRSEEHGTSSFKGLVEVLFDSFAYQARFDKNICESDKESKGFAYLRQNFPKINEAKMKEGIFIGPQIRQIFEDQDFGTKLHSTEEKPGRHLKASAATFWAIKKA